MRLGQQPIEDGVGDGGVADPAVPVLDRQLVGDDRGPLAGPVVDDLEQIGAGGRIDAAGAPVVEDQDVGAGEFCQPLARSRRSRAARAVPRPGAARAGRARCGPAGRRTAPARRPARSCPRRSRRRTGSCRRARSSPRAPSPSASCGRGRGSRRSRRPRCWRWGSSAAPSAAGACACGRCASFISRSTSSASRSSKVIACTSGCPLCSCKPSAKPSSLRAFRLAIVALSSMSVVLAKFGVRDVAITGSGRVRAGSGVPGWSSRRRRRPEGRCGRGC